MGGQIGILGRPPRPEHRQQHGTLEHEPVAIAAARKPPQEALNRVQQLQRLSIAVVMLTDEAL